MNNIGGFIPALVLILAGLWLYGHGRIRLLGNAVAGRLVVQK